MISKDLPGILTSLGLTVTKLSERFISVLFKGRKQPRRYAIDTLIRDVEINQKSMRKGPLLPPRHDGPSLH